MILFSYKSLGAKNTVCYFWNGEEFSRDNYLTIYYQSKLPINGLKTTNFHSATTDLCKSHEEIFEHFNKGVRYEIRRAEREGVETCQLKNNEIDKKRLKKFFKFFNGFAKQKSLRRINKRVIKAAIDNNVFMLSFAKDKEGNELVYHAYIVGETESRLLHSCSQYRSNMKNKNLVAMANRLLHFNDMKYLKNNNITMYDWGGVGLTSEVKNISNFKMEFNGAPQDYYTTQVVDKKNENLLTKLKLIVKKILKR